MKKNNIIIIYSSHLSDEYNNKFNNEITQHIGCNHQIFVYKNFNQYSLSEIYNNAIKDHNTSNSIMVFLHNDIKIYTKNWGTILLNKFNYSDYQIIGVAGTTELNNTGKWWDNVNKMVGVVEHADPLIENKSWVNKYSEEFIGIKPVVIIDGLFIAADINNVEHYFDEEIKGFHFYDLGFCFPNYLDGCNVGVITDIRILHKSLGLVNKEWDDNRKLFVKKYKDELPQIINNIIINDVNIKTLAREPKISVIIPTKNNFEILNENLKSWSEIVKYKNYEILIADTGSDENIIEKYKTFEKYKLNIKIIKYNYYNFAKINNDVVKNHVSKDTEILLFCNDDIELLNDAVTILVENYLKHEKTVGTLGIRLHYVDGTIQHNGIIYKETNKIFDVSHRDLKLNENYYTEINTKSFGNTGAFLMINKHVFFSNNMFNENYTECFEDVELNMKCLKNGLNNITCSNAVAYHYESISRNKNANKYDKMKDDIIKIRNFYSNEFRK